MASMISIGAFSKLIFQKWTAWANGIVWHIVSDHCIYSGWYFGEEIVEPKLWNFSKTENNVFWRIFIIFNEYRKRNCERTFIFYTVGKNESLAVHKYTQERLSCLVSQTLWDAVTLWNCGIFGKLWKFLFSEHNLNIR